MKTSVVPSEKTHTLKLPRTIEVPEKCIDQLRAVAAWRRMTPDECLADLLQEWFPPNIDCDFENMAVRFVDQDDPAYNKKASR